MKRRSACGLSVTALCFASALLGLPSATAQKQVAASPTAHTTLAPHAERSLRLAWIDKSTGHRVIQLTPEKNSKGLYFTDTAFTPDGKDMIYMAAQSIYVLNMKTHKTRQLVVGPVNDIVVAHKSPTVYFMRAGETSLYLVRVGNGQIVKVADLPARSAISSLNADDTLAVGSYTEAEMPPLSLVPNQKDSRAAQFDARMNAHLPMDLFTLDLKTAELKTILHSTDWLDHIQFSPTDSKLLMYAHEGLWYRVDRIWTIRTDGTENKLIHKRTTTNEIAGHEFWDADGKTIWYDLQVPRGKNFYVASYNTETKERRQYHVDRDAWSIHYNVASDGSLFCGDGGDYGQVAMSKDGQWIELFTPSLDPQTPEVDQKDMIQSGAFTAEHLVNMSKHKYTLEPNVRFSPDHKLVIFNSNVLGASYIFAVEVAKASDQPSTH